LLIFAEITNNYPLPYIHSPSVRELNDELRNLIRRKSLVSHKEGIFYGLEHISSMERKPV
jgi:hypothetical protein